MPHLERGRGPARLHTEAASAESCREKEPGFSEATLSPTGLTCPPSAPVELPALTVLSLSRRGEADY